MSTAYDNLDGYTEIPPLRPQIPLRRLYIAYFLARWNARFWEFSVGLYMIYLWPSSLLLAAIYGAFESSSTAIFGPIVGNWVENSTYLKVLRVWLGTQNISFISAALLVFILLFFENIKSSNLPVFIFLVIVINLSGAASVLSTLAGTILIEREWVVVICESHPPQMLTAVNSTIRRIDLLCNLVAPVISGFIISFISIKASAISIAVWSVCASWIEYKLFIHVYTHIPELRKPRTHQDEYIPPTSYVSSCSAYVRQSVCPAGVALSILYFTVLSFGTLMTAALTWQGIPAYVVGIGRGVNAVFGISSTVLYPCLRDRMSTLRTGVVSVWSQWGCLLVCVGGIWVPYEYASAYLLMSGVAASRLGLWMFDLAVIQLMQEEVSDSERCVVGGVQNSLQAFMDLLAYVVGIIVSDPRDFWKLTLLSFSAVSLAALIYSFFALKRGVANSFQIE